MRIFGLSITRAEKALQPPSAGRWWWPTVRESYAGAWAAGVEVKRETALTFHAVFACQTLIAGDIAKLRLKLMRRAGDIWQEDAAGPMLGILQKPNSYQTRIQFYENWVLSKLQRGNAYVWKERDVHGEVQALHVLNPDAVRVLVSDTGDVFYQLSADNLAGLEAVTLPAREIIHDRFNCLFHPLVGISPLHANGLAAMQGVAIQNNSATFFQNGSRPGGVLSAPANIPDETAQRIKDYWETEFTGSRQGKIAVLGDGLKYEPLAVTAVDAQMIEQLKWTAEVVCSTYYVPPFMIGVGDMPSYNNVQALWQQYYAQALQAPIEAIELCLEEGLDMGSDVGAEFDLDGLLRMDTATQIDTLSKAVGSGLMAPDEARAKIDLPTVDGGATPYLQQQNYSLAALARRDAQPDPFGHSTSTPAAPPAVVGDGKAFAAVYEKHLREALHG